MVVSLGYRPDVPDRRDVSIGTNAGNTALSRVFQGRVPGSLAPLRSGTAEGLKADLPPAVNLLEKINGGLQWPVDDQGRLESCTAHAVVGLLEYLSLTQPNQAADLSRLFVYNATRRLLGLTGDNGAYIRTTIKAVATFGAPPEDVWPYEPRLLNAEPDAYTFAYAQAVRALSYFRLDGYDQLLAGFNHRGKQTLALLRRMLTAGYPVALGFPAYDSITVAPEIPYPTNRDRLVGGHAVLAVGFYDKGEPAVPPADAATPTKDKPVDVGAEAAAPRPSLPTGMNPPTCEGGAILIRNSWGPSWGCQGYGWLPYAYVEAELAADLWTVFKESWVRDVG